MGILARHLIPQFGAVGLNLSSLAGVRGSHILLLGNHSVSVVQLRKHASLLCKARVCALHYSPWHGAHRQPSLFAIFLFSLSHQLIYLSGVIIMDPQSVLHYPKQAIIHIVTFAFALLTSRSWRPSVTESHKIIPLPVI